MPFKRGSSDNWWISYREEGKTGRVAKSSFTTDLKTAIEIENACRAHYIQKRDRPPEGHKRCTRCSNLENKFIFKPINEFSKGHSWCKNCCKEVSKKNYNFLKENELTYDKKGHVLFKPDRLGKKIHNFLMSGPPHSSRPYRRKL